MATLPVYRTWTSGEVITAAYFNSNLRDAGNFLLSWPVMECRQTLAQAITTAIPAPLLFDTNDVDTDNGHSTSTNTSRYVGKTQGRFQVSGAATFQFVAGGRRSCWWLLNGTSINASQALTPTVTANDIEVVARTRTVFLNGSTDYVELDAFQDSGSTVNTYATNQGQSGMSVRMVGTT